MKLTKFIPLLNVSFVTIPLVTSCSAQPILETELEVDWEKDVYNGGYKRQTGLSQLTELSSDEATTKYLEEVKKDHLIFLDDYVIGTAVAFNEKKAGYINFDKTIGYSLLDVNPTKQTISLRCDINGSTYIKPYNTKEVMFECWTETPFSVVLKNVPIEVTWVNDGGWHLYVDVEALGENHSWSVIFDTTSLPLKGNVYIKDIEFAFDDTIQLPKMINYQTRQGIYTDNIEQIFDYFWHFPIDYLKNVKA